MIEIKIIHFTLQNEKPISASPFKSSIQLILLRERIHDLQLAAFYYFKYYLKVIKCSFISNVNIPSSFHLLGPQSMDLGSHYLPEEPWSLLLQRKFISMKPSVTSGL